MEQDHGKAQEPDTTPTPRTLIEFRVTFGQRYDREHHPRFVAGQLPVDAHPDGWFTVLAPDYVQARVFVYGLLGTAWCDLYEMPDPVTGRTSVGTLVDPIGRAESGLWSAWTLGELARFEAPEQPHADAAVQSGLQVQDFWPAGAEIDVLVGRRGWIPAVIAGQPDGRGRWLVRFVERTDYKRIAASLIRARQEPDA